MRKYNILVGKLLLLLSTQATAHVRFKVTGTLKPRSIDSGLKSAPCGDAAVDETRRVSLIKGQTLKIEWEETINHPGSFKISFSLDGSTGFEANLLKEVPDDQNGSVIYADPASWHQFSTEIQVPNTLCDQCAFQLIQVMTDRNPATMYYSCADVKITEPPPPPTPTVTATTTSTSTNTATGAPTAPTNLNVIVHRKTAESNEATERSSADLDDNSSDHSEHGAP